MKSRLSDICEYVKGKVDIKCLNDGNYVSTENMLPNKGGVTIVRLPASMSNS